MTGGKKTEESSCGECWEKVMQGLNLQIRLPENVFTSRWKRYRFFQSDWMFGDEFVEAVRLLLCVDGYALACLVNLDRASPSERESASICIDIHLSGQRYIDKLKGNGPEVGWLYDMERYGCTSGGDSWFVYCEKNNDIGIVALNEDLRRLEVSRALSLLRAGPLTTVIKGPDAASFPFAALTPQWAEALAANFVEG